MPAELSSIRRALAWSAYGLLWGLTLMTNATLFPEPGIPWDQDMVLDGPTFNGLQRVRPGIAVRANPVAQSASRI